jgi:hypothetical protein
MLGVEQRSLKSGTAAQKQGAGLPVPRVFICLAGFTNELALGISRATPARHTAARESTDMGGVPPLLRQSTFGGYHW